MANLCSCIRLLLSAHLFLYLGPAELPFHFTFSIFPSWKGMRFVQSSAHTKACPCLRQCENAQEDEVVGRLAPEVAAADQDHHGDQGGDQGQHEDPLATPHEEPDRLVEEDGHDAHRHQELDAEEAEHLRKITSAHTFWIWRAHLRYHSFNCERTKSCWLALPGCKPLCTHSRTQNWPRNIGVTSRDQTALKYWPIVAKMLSQAKKFKVSQNSSNFECILLT